TVLIVFRIVLTAVGGESIYYDEQSKFVCNSSQPGCKNVCYDAFAPLSQVGFWVFQIILVATPSLMYLGYAVNKIARAEEQADGGGASGFSQRKLKKRYLAGRKQHRGIEEAEDDNEENPMIYEVTEMESDAGAARGDGERHVKVKARHDGRQRIKEDGLMRIYVLQLLAPLLLELAFLCGQYALYGFTIPASYVCSDLPCPHSVDCFVCRPTEKTIFLLIMYSVSLLCLLLNIWEMLHLGIGTICEIMQSRQLPLPHSELYKLTKKNRALNEGEAYDSYPFTWNRREYTNKEENLCKAGRGRTVRNRPTEPQIKLKADNQRKPNRERRHRQASRHASSKAGTDSSSTGSSSKYGMMKGSEWI
uniref:Gap junction protein gamma 1 n=1 Tax=Oryzias melastigma TaxID=30732 RepID=A0A3B3BD90_ORYME